MHSISDLHGLRGATGGPSSRAGGCASLTHLAAGFCRSLTQLPTNLGSASALVELDVRWCEALAALPPLGGLSNLWRLQVAGCTSLAALPRSLGQLTGEAGCLTRTTGC